MDLILLHDEADVPVAVLVLNSSTEGGGET